MALTKQKKVDIVEQTARLLDESKMTVVARYQGTSVQSLQTLRRQAKEDQTTVRVIKNRLVKRALQDTKHLKGVDTAVLNGQLIYAFNSVDEVAPAQAIARFARGEPQLEFVAGFSAEGTVLPAEDVRALADLPTKEQLRGQLVGLFASPLTGLATVLNGNARGLLTALGARENQLSN